MFFINHESKELNTTETTYFSLLVDILDFKWTKTKLFVFIKLSISKFW